jgi:AAA family ATP:ADP antiporter
MHASHYVLRPVRDYVSVQSRPKDLPWLFIATFITTLLMAPVFRALSPRVPRHELIWVIYLISCEFWCRRWLWHS